MVTIGDLAQEIDDEYITVVNAADEAIKPGDTLPPDPLPDL